MKNSTMRVILSIVGGVVVVAGIAFALIHFWGDIKAMLPCCCKKDEALDEFEDIEA